MLQPLRAAFSRYKDERERDTHITHISSKALLGSKEICLKSIFQKKGLKKVSWTCRECDRTHGSRENICPDL